jgi:WD40 repeat protein
LSNPAPRDRQSDELNRILARSRSALRKEAIFCTIRFNSDASNFSFAVGAAVVFIMSADGSLVGFCLVPTFHSQSESRTRAICFSSDSRWLAVSGPVNSVTVIDIASRRIMQSLDEHTAYQSAIAIFSDSCKVITGAFDGQKLHWTNGDWKVVKSIQHGPEKGSLRKEEMIVAPAVGGDDEYAAVGFMSGVVEFMIELFRSP